MPPKDDEKTTASEYSTPCARKENVKDFSRVLYRVLLVLPLLLSVGARTNAAGNDESRVAAAIFSRYETVFYTNADLSSRFSFFKGLSRQSAGMLALPFGYLIGALDSLNPHASEEILGKTDSLLVGVRDFTRPHAAGSAAQLGAFAYVASFGKQGIPRLDKYFNQVSVTSVGGHSVWRW